MASMNEDRGNGYEDTEEEQEGSSGVSMWIIAGIIGVVLIVVGIIVCCFCLGEKNTAVQAAAPADSDAASASDAGAASASASAGSSGSSDDGDDEKAGKDKEGTNTGTGTGTDEDSSDSSDSDAVSGNARRPTSPTYQKFVKAPINKQMKVILMSRPIPHQQNQGQGKGQNQFVQAAQGGWQQGGWQQGGWQQNQNNQGGWQQNQNNQGQQNQNNQGQQNQNKQEYLAIDPSFFKEIAGSVKGTAFRVNWSPAPVVEVNQANGNWNDWNSQHTAWNGYANGWYQNQSTWECKHIDGTPCLFSQDEVDPTKYLWANGFQDGFYWNKREYRVQTTGKGVQTVEIEVGDSHKDSDYLRDWLKTKQVTVNEDSFAKTGFMLSCPWWNTFEKEELDAKGAVKPTRGNAYVKAVNVMLYMACKYNYNQGGNQGGNQNQGGR